MRGYVYSKVIWHSPSHKQFLLPRIHWYFKIILTNNRIFTENFAFPFQCIVKLNDSFLKWTVYTKIFLNCVSLLIYLKLSFHGNAIDKRNISLAIPYLHLKWKLKQMQFFVVFKLRLENCDKNILIGMFCFSFLYKVQFMFEKHKILKTCSILHTRCWI